MTKQITNKKEFEAHLAILREQAEVVSDRFQSIATKNQLARIDRWKAAGGCQKCRGRSKYVIWDTLDSLSGCYAQFEGCKDCTPESRAVGACPDVVGKYDRVGGTYGLVEEALQRWATDEEARLQEQLAKESGAAWKEIENLRYAWEQHHSSDNGKEMVVTRKWKHIHKGMTGRVFWQRDNRVGLRVGDERDDRGYWKDTFFCNESQLGNPKPFLV